MEPNPPNYDLYVRLLQDVRLEPGDFYRARQLTEVLEKSRAEFQRFSSALERVIASAALPPASKPSSLSSNYPSESRVVTSPPPPILHSGEKRPSSVLLDSSPEKRLQKRRTAHAPT